MLRSLYVMLDYHLAATDGVQGTVSDFLIDDESWIVHYLVAETATAIGKRNVLILPFVLKKPEWELKRVPVSLTCEQIRMSPPLEADMPIAQQRETGLKRPGSHLRSMRELLGYTIHSKNGEAGTVEDFIIEDMLWGIHSVVIRLKEDSPRSVLVAPESIRSVSWTGKAAWLNLTPEEIAAKPDFNPNAPVNRAFDYYGRPIVPLPPCVSDSPPEHRP